MLHSVHHCFWKSMKLQGTGILSDGRKKDEGSKCLISLDAEERSDFPKVSQGVCGTAEPGGLIRLHKLPDASQVCGANPSLQSFPAPWASEADLVSLCQGTPWVVCEIREAGVRAGSSFWRSLATGPQLWESTLGSAAAWIVGQLGATGTRSPAQICMSLFLSASCKDYCDSALPERMFPVIAGEGLMVSMSPHAFTDQVLPGRAAPREGIWFLRFGWERQM